ncbi:MAG: hypothetical protein LBS74_02965 [Oscillospiraceae bacterium]|jgi:hypothetical protein|nr:hypothetical protein [Oscillospiraceae bacterium]
MKKPTGYDQAKAWTGEYEKLEAGGHICVIKQVKEETSKSGNQMLKIAFDICEGEHAGYYQRLFEKQVSEEEPKWRGVYYVVLTDDKNSTARFKGFVTSIEASNKGFAAFKGDELDLNAFKGKLFGGIFGKEQWEYNGKTGWTTKIFFLRSVEAIRNGVDIPEPRPLKNGYTAQENGSFEEIIADDDLPF